MKISWTITVLLITYSLSFSIVFAESPWIEWGAKELEWKDFEGIPDTYPPDYDGKKNREAFTTTYIVNGARTPNSVNSVICQYQIMRFDAIAEFVKNESWVKIGSDSAVLLEHERGHFDIAEIHARKLEQQLLFKILPCPDEVYDISKIDQHFGKLRDKFITDELKPADKSYDIAVHDERGFLIESRQKQWTQLIQNQLNSNESLPNYTISTISPKKQQNEGIPIEKVTCTTGWKLIFKPSLKSSACVTPAVFSKLIERGWSG